MTALRAYRPDPDDSDIPESKPSSEPPSPEAVISVQEVIDLYIENLQARNKNHDFSNDNLANALRELRRFKTEYGKLAVSACRQHQLTRFFTINPQWKSPSTKKRVASTILACFRWAAEEDLILHCPFRWPKILKGIPDKVRRPADPSEYVQLMRFGSRPLRRALFFLRRTGVRPIEMRDLVWTDVNLGPFPHLHLDKHKTRKKTGKPRKIGLDVATANFLRALKRNQLAATAADPKKGKKAKPVQHVFLNCRGTPWDRHTFARHLRRYAERLGIDEGVEERVSSYCLRHTYVCDGIEAGVTTRRIADQIGHVKTNMIDTVYGSHTRERIEHLNDVATEITGKRKRRVAPKKPPETTPEKAG